LLGAAFVITHPGRQKPSYATLMLKLTWRNAACSLVHVFVRELWACSAWLEKLY